MLFRSPALSAASVDGFPYHTTRQLRMQYEIVPERTCNPPPGMCILQIQMSPEAGNRQNCKENHSFARKKAQPFWLDFFGAGDEASPPRASGTRRVALPSSRQCPTVHRTVGLNCSSLFHPKKKSPAVWLDFSFWSG